MVKTTAAHDYEFYAFSTLETVSITTITGPNSSQPEGYIDNSADFIGVSLPANYYPIRGSSITVGTANKVILWLE